MKTMMGALAASLLLAGAAAPASADTEELIEVVRESGHERLAREHVGAQDPRRPVGDGCHHHEDDRREREAAQERHYIKASQT